MIQLSGQQEHAGGRSSTAISSRTLFIPAAAVDSRSDTGVRCAVRIQAQGSHRRDFGGLLKARRVGYSCWPKRLRRCSKATCQGSKHLARRLLGLTNSFRRGWL